jgi:ABC-type Fe3+ transport system substrate-binding protein
VRRIAFAVVAALALAFPPARSGADTVSADAARREGSVVWYTTTEATTVDVLAQRFAQLYPGIAVKTLRLSTAELTPRVITEQHGSLFNADLVSGDESQLSLLVTAGALQPYRSPAADRFIAGSVEPNGAWTSLYQDTTVIAWNTERLRADGLRAPATISDLARPEYRGRVGINENALSWYLGLVSLDARNRDLVRALGANQPFLTASHTATMTQLVTGEFDATPTVYGYLAAHEKATGAPIAFVNPVPALVTLVPIALAKNAPHPNAARLFLDFLLSREGQRLIVATTGRSSSRADVPGDRRVFDAKRPFVVVHPPADAAAFAAAQRAFRTDLGLP